MNALEIRHAASRGYVKILVATLLGLSPVALPAQEKPPAKPAVPAKAPAKAPATAPAAGRGTAAAAPAAGRGAAAPAAGRGTAAPAAGRGTTPAAGRGATPGPGRGAATAAHPGGAPGGGHPGAGPAEHGAVHADGGGAAHDGRSHQAGERTERGAHGEEVTRGPHGEVRDVHARGMDIHHGPGGERMISRERADHSRVVSDRFGHGYIQRGYSYHGAEFVHRTYYVNGVAYGRVYRPYMYGGVSINVYAPGVFFAPAFYGYAYYPWAAPVTFGWGWGGSPWYGYYGGYFTPYPVYAGPPMWLTDYLVAQSLQAAYQQQAANQAAAQAAQANFTPMSPDVKQQIADEVQRQLNLERTEAAAGAQAAPDPGNSGVARILGDNTAHVFVVSVGLDVQSDAGPCPVTEGDVLQLSVGARPDPASASLRVLASKGQDCQKGATVTLGVADLQDMQNRMRETLDLGLAELQKKQGHDGIPAAPAAAAAAPVQTGYAAIAPPPDPNVASELSAQTKEADQAEQEALQPGPGGPYAGPNPEPVAGSAAPAAKGPITVGQTPDEVIAILGQPVNIVDMGPKKIYVFKDLKVTFLNGKAQTFQ
jgi:hypothetical protein